MLRLVYTTQFKKDIRRTEKRDKNLQKLRLVIEILAAGERLDPIHRDHKLLGKLQGRRECHIESDWLLIYKLDEEQIIFERTGTHSDLFR